MLMFCLTFKVSVYVYVSRKKAINSDFCNRTTKLFILTTFCVCFSLINNSFKVCFNIKYSSQVSSWIFTFSQVISLWYTYDKWYMENYQGYVVYMYIICCLPVLRRCTPCRGRRPARRRCRFRSWRPAPSPRPPSWPSGRPHSTPHSQRQTNWGN